MYSAYACIYVRFNVFPFGDFDKLWNKYCFLCAVRCLRPIIVNRLSLLLCNCVVKTKSIHDLCDCTCNLNENSNKRQFIGIDEAIALLLFVTSAHPRNLLSR